MTPEQYAEERIDTLAEELAEILTPHDVRHLRHDIAYSRRPRSADMVRFVQHLEYRKET